MMGHWISFTNVTARGDRKHDMRRPWSTSISAPRQCAPMPTQCSMPGAGLGGTLAEAALIVKDHTKVRGLADYSLRLSRRCAELVRRYLIRRHGIAPGRLQTAGYGETCPIADNADEVGRVLNRRVEFVRVRCAECRVDDTAVNPILLLAVGQGLADSLTHLRPCDPPGAYRGKPSDTAPPGSRTSGPPTP